MSPRNKTDGFAFSSKELKNILFKLGAHSSAAPDGISAAFLILYFIKTANYLAPNISVIFHMLTMTRKF